MTFEFRDAVRRDVPLLILLAGGTGAGKTESAMRLATGLAGGQKFAVIDTENGRALHKADDYSFTHSELGEPFTPERYVEAIRDADATGASVVVVDSGSHEYDGIGGVLEMQMDEFERMGNRESARLASWKEPKRRHKLYVRELLRTRAHVIICHRAEDKIEIVKEGDKTIVRPKASLVGAEGWIPICEKRLPFEATISFLLTQDNPGVPKPIKLERRHADLIPLDKQLDEEAGRRLAEWAAGAKTGPAEPAQERSTATGAAGGGASTPSFATEGDIDGVRNLAEQAGESALTALDEGIAKQRADYDGNVRRDWLSRQSARIAEKLKTKAAA